MWTISSIQGYDKEAWEWDSRMTNFMRQITDPEIDESEFCESYLKGRNFGGFLNGELQVIVHGDPKNEDLIEGHVFTAKTVDLPLMCASIAFGTHDVLRDFKQVIVGTPTKHTTLHRMLTGVGYRDTGLKTYRGGRRMIELSFFLIQRGDNGQ